MPTETPQNFITPEHSLPEAPQTASEVAGELGRSVTAVKSLARQINAPVMKTATGIWLFPPVAVAKLRAEMERRRIEAMR